MYMESGGRSVMVVVCFYLAFSTHPLPHKTQTVHGAGCHQASRVHPAEASARSPW